MRVIFGLYFPKSIVNIKSRVECKTFKRIVLQNALLKLDNNVITRERQWPLVNGGKLHSYKQTIRAGFGSTNQQKRHGWENKQNVINHSSFEVEKGKQTAQASSARGMLL